MSENISEPESSDRLSARVTELEAKLAQSHEEQQAMADLVCSEAEIVGYYGVEVDSALTCFRSAIQQAQVRAVAAEAALREALKLDVNKLLERTAQLIAHRGCCGTEHDQP